jgi:hypothetical protein
MWLKIQEANSVWYFDATGSILKSTPELKNQKQVLLYTVAMRDPLSNTSISIYDFVTTSHNFVSISRYLSYFKHIMDVKIPRKYLIHAPVIVTDYSWPSLNSILHVFNDSMNIKQYLSLLFELLVENPSPSRYNCIKSKIKVRLYLCSTHFFNMMRRRVRKIEKNKTLCRDFLFMFSLLQNSTSMNQFELYLKNIFHIYMCQNSDGEALEFIKNEVKKRTPADSCISADELDKFDDLGSFDNDSIFFNEYDEITYESIKNSSPFKNYFSRLISKYQNESEKSKFVIFNIIQHLNILEFF